MKRKSLFVFGLAALMGIGLATTACNNNSTPATPTYKVTVASDSDPDALVNGLQTSYKVDDLVTFYVNVKREVKDTKAVDTVTTNGIPRTASQGIYTFGMPAQDVSIKVTLKDTRELVLTIDDGPYYAGTEFAYSAKLATTSVTPTMSVEPAGAVTFDTANKTFTPVTVGNAKIKASYTDGGTTFTTSKDIAIVANPRMSVNEMLADAITTAANKNNGLSGKAYEIASKVVAISDDNGKGYFDVVVYDGTDYLVSNVNTTTRNKVNVGDQVITKGEAKNYYGLIEFIYDKGSAATMDFESNPSGTVATPTPTTMDGTAFNTYYSQAETASSLSSGTGLTAVSEVSMPTYIKADATVSKFEDAGETKTRLTISGASHDISISKTAGENKTIIEALSDGASVSIEGFLLGCNTGKGYSNMIVTAVTIESNFVKITNEKLDVYVDSTLQMTAVSTTEDPITWSVDDASVATINTTSGLLTPVAVGTVNVTATCGTLKDTVAVAVKAREAKTLPIQLDMSGCTSSSTALPDEEWTYITNNPSYPTPSFYKGGLKCAFFNSGVQSPEFKPNDSVKVTLTVAGLNENTKSAGTDPVFTIYGLDATGATVATGGVNEISATGDYSVTITGTGIVAVKVLFTNYANNGTKNCNVNLSKVAVAEAPTGDYVKITNTTLSVEEGSNLQMTADTNLTDPIVWSVDDTEVATIDSSTGLLTAVSKGNVNVTATIGEVSDTVKVTVTEKAGAKALPCTLDMTSCAKTDSALPDKDWTYITNDEKYPNPSFYAGGLKLAFPNCGLMSPELAPVGKVVTNIDIKALNENSKSGSDTDPVFTVYALNADEEVIDTQTLATVTTGENKVTLTGTGIVYIKIMFTNYPKNAKGDKCCNVNLQKVTLTDK